MIANAVTNLRNRTRETLQAARDVIDPEAAKQRKDAERILQRMRQQRRDDLYWLMSDPRGRRTVWALLAQCGLNTTTLNEHGRPVASREGRRTIAVEWSIELCANFPDLYLLMQSEALNACRA